MKTNKKQNSKVKICSYNKRCSHPDGYHYLRVKVLTRDEGYFDDAENIDFCGKDKTIFGWHFGWSCEQDYSAVPKKQLQKAIRRANRLAKDDNVLECKIFNALM